MDMVGRGEEEGGVARGPVVGRRRWLEAEVEREGGNDDHGWGGWGGGGAVLGICVRGVAVEAEEEEEVLLCTGCGHKIGFGRRTRVQPGICPSAAAAGSRPGPVLKGKRERTRRGKRKGGASEYLQWHIKKLSFIFTSTLVSSISSSNYIVCALFSP